MKNGEIDRLVWLSELRPLEAHSRGCFTPSFLQIGQLSSQMSTPLNSPPYFEDVYQLPCLSHRRNLGPNGLICDSAVG